MCGADVTDQFLAIQTARYGIQTTVLSIDCASTRFHSQPRHCRAYKFNESTFFTSKRCTLVSSEHVVHVTDASFEDDVLKADTPILLDFWAEWCGPCKMIAPMLDEVASEYKDKLKIAKINIDENPKTPQRFNVRGIPTLILFKNGQVEGQKVGALRKSDLAAFLDGKL